MTDEERAKERWDNEGGNLPDQKDAKRINSNEQNFRTELPDRQQTACSSAAQRGIVPRVNNSNKTVKHGRITKLGSKTGRTTLVQCSLVAIRHSPYLKEYYERIKKRRGHGKAKIATARKYLGIIYDTLKNDWVFEDFNNFVIAE